MALHVCTLTYLKSMPLFWTTLYVLTMARNAQKEFLIDQSSRSHATYRRPSLDGF